MSKYEQVVNGLECCTCNKIKHENCLICPYTDSSNSCIDDLEKDVLEVLKEQQQKIEVLEDQNAKLIRQKEARFQPVQCKDCKNSECVGRFGDIVCGRTGTPHRPEWYCPCGEPKDKP